MARRDDIKIEMSPDELDDLKNREYQRGHDVGIEIGAKHSVPSPDTKNFMEETKTNVAILSTKLDNVESLIKGQHAENKEDHETIVKQQAYTNGKVAELISWREQTKGALMIISIMVSGLLIPLAVYFIKDVLTHQ